MFSSRAVDYGDANDSYLHMRLTNTLGDFTKQACNTAAHGASNVTILTLPESVLFLPSFSFPSSYLFLSASLSGPLIMELAGDSSVSCCVMGTALYSSFGGVS